MRVRQLAAIVLLSLTASTALAAPSAPIDDPGSIFRRLARIIHRVVHALDNDEAKLSPPIP